MNKFYYSLKLKLILGCAVALFAVIAIVHGAMYVFIRDIISEQLGQSAKSVAVTIAARIMEDVDEYKAFLKTPDVNSAYYRDMQEYFARIKSSGPIIKFIYTERPIDKDTVEFILDAPPLPGDDYAMVSPPGETTFMDEASRAVYATGKPAVLPPTVHPDYGTLLGGCAPIFDEGGVMLGLVGVNFDISAMSSQVMRLQYSMLLLYALILAVSIFALNRYSGAVLQPMVKDKLTGAYNKSFYEPLLRMELKNAEKNNTELALLLFDLDNFKGINDIYGHSFGDTVLAEVSRTVLGCLRSDDYFIRYGGDEFAVIIPNVSIDVVMKIAERIRASVGSSDIMNRALDRSIRMTISMGVAYLGGQKISGRQLLENADTALYEAKVSRNSVAIFRNTAAS